MVTSKKSEESLRPEMMIQGAVGIVFIALLIYLNMSLWEYVALAVGVATLFVKGKEAESASDKYISAAFTVLLALLYFGCMIWLYVQHGLLGVISAIALAFLYSNYQSIKSAS